MYGKMTTSRMGIIGRRFVSDFSFEVSIVPLQGLTLSLALSLEPQTALSGILELAGLF
jgi:uncharacterized membrane protein